MKKIIPYIVLIVILASIIIPVGIGYIQPPNLRVAIADELNVSGWSFTIQPAKYFYRHRGVEMVTIIVRNLSSQEARFDMGAGNIEAIPSYGNLTYSWQVYLDGSIKLIPITKIATPTAGLNVIEQLALKIQPEGKGSE